MTHDWKPTARLETLRLRAELLRRTRDYFRAQNVLEVETPILARATVTDLHLASLRTQITGHGDFYLQTSPEYAMKRLLAAGSGDIYQISRVFRDEERGRRHNPEFTMIEWYRLNFDLQALMADAERLLRILLAEKNPGPAEFLTYDEALQKHAGIDAFNSTLDDLKDCARSHNIDVVDFSQERDDWLDLLMSMVVGPKLGQGHITFLHAYPATQAALARLNPTNPTVADRFEIYMEGMELANAFHELVNEKEQQSRFEKDLQARRARSLDQPPIDKHLLAALESGLPDVSGIAMGFDRVVMLATNASHIDEVLTFPVSRA